MTTTLLILCGAGIGFLVASLLFIVLLHVLTKARNVNADKTLEHSQDCLDALNERNNIDIGIAQSMKRMADCMEEHWK